MGLIPTLSTCKTTAPRQVPSSAKVAEAVTNMVIQVRQTGASTSTVTSDQRDSQASGSTTRDLLSTRIPRMAVVESDPPWASSSGHSRSIHRDLSQSTRQPVFPAEDITIRWTTPNAQPRWRAEELESLEAMETSVRQIAAGATDVAAGCMLQYLDRLRTRLDDDLQFCMRELQGARKSAAKFGPPGPVQHLMGQIQGLWERLGVHQNRIDALIKEKEQARGQCDQMATAQTNAQREIRQLRAANDQLQQDTDR